MVCIYCMLILCLTTTIILNIFHKISFHFFLYSRFITIHANKFLLKLIVLCDDKKKQNTQSMSQAFLCFDKILAFRFKQWMTIFNEHIDNWRYIIGHVNFLSELFDCNFNIFRLLIHLFKWFCVFLFLLYNVSVLFASCVSYMQSDQI